MHTSYWQQWLYLIYDYYRGDNETPEAFMPKYWCIWIIIKRIPMSQIPPQWCQTDNQRQHYQEHKLYETMRSTSLEEDVVEYMKFSKETFGTPEIKQTDEKVSVI